MAVVVRFSNNRHKPQHGDLHELLSRRRGQCNEVSWAGGNDRFAPVAAPGVGCGDIDSTAVVVDFFSAPRE